MAQAYLSYLLRLVSTGLIPVIAEVSIAAFRDNAQDATKDPPSYFLLY